MKKTIIKLLKILLIAITCFVVIYIVVFKTSLFLADIRPEHMKGAYVLQNNGRGYLVNAQNAHGIAAWKNSDSIRYHVEQQFNGRRITFLVSPTGKAQMAYKFVSYPNDKHPSYYNCTSPGKNFYISKDDNGIFQKENGKKTYGGFSKEFFFLAIEHLIEFPFRMESVNIVEHIGQQTWNGKNYELIYATWGSIAPNKDIDQYIIWINTTTGLIDRFDATGRQILPFAKATAIFSYEANADEVIIPSTIQVHRNGPDGMLIMELNITDQPATPP